MDAGTRSDVDPRLLLTTLGEACCAVPADIAERTGVDEEHVRAALASLERAGFVRHHGEDSWYLPPRSSGELRELYVVAILLEGLALRSCPRFEPSALERMREHNARLRASAGDIEAAIAADYDFHRELVASCGNTKLIRTHLEAKAALARYDHDYWDDAGHIERSTAEHDEIIAALADGDHERAAGIVRQNFERALPGLARKLGERG